MTDSGRVATEPRRNEGKPAAETEPAAGPEVVVEAVMPAGKPGPPSFPFVGAGAIRHAFKNATCACSQQLVIRI